MDFEAPLFSIQFVEWAVESLFCVLLRARLLRGNTSWGRIAPGAALILEEEPLTSCSGRESEWELVPVNLWV